VAKIGISLSEVARRVGRDKSTLLRHVQRGLVPRLPDGSYDEDAVREALTSNLDPARSRPLKPAAGEIAPSLGDVAATPVATIEDAQEAVALIRRVLAEEGRQIDGAPTYDDVRSAELILKARERAINIAASEGSMVPMAPLVRHVSEAFRNYRKSLEALPARYGAQIAAEVGCDVGKLDRALSTMIRAHLTELSAPVVR
jgi:hypothetical protein